MQGLVKVAHYPFLCGVSFTVISMASVDSIPTPWTK